MYTCIYIKRCFLDFFLSPLPTETQISPKKSTLSPSPYNKVELLVH